MPELNDDNTRACIRRAHDPVSTMLAHFSAPDATWDNFGKADIYVEYLKLHLEELLNTVESELQSRRAVEPTDFGS